MTPNLSKRLPWATYVWNALGPGVVFALTCIGPGDFVSNTAAGAQHRYQFLWVVVLGHLLRFVWLDAAARYIFTAGESLLEGYRRVSPAIVWLCVGSLVLEGHLRNVYKYILMGACLHLVLPLPAPYSMPVWTLFSVGLGLTILVFRDYPTLEFIFKMFMAAMAACLLLVSIMTPHDPAAIAKGIFVPSFSGVESGFGSILVVGALLGSAAGSLTNLTYPYFLQEKGWQDETARRKQRLDLAVSMGLSVAMAALLQMVAAGTLFGTGATVETGEDLVVIFSDKLGLAGRLAFAFGLWSAAFTGFTGATSGFGLVATDIWRRFIGPARNGQRTGRAESAMTDPFYRGLVLFWILSPLYVLLTDWKPVIVVLAVQALGVVLLPIWTLALLRITNDHRLMGEQTNRPLTNLTLWVLVGICILVLFQGLMKL